ncbi:GTP-binding protein [Williamsoniiplasma somnilux]|uniref:Probable GTP-binding protein EngB n=1 Tax=Williamsoniiplasma somnilux TaxID=215578 RepID=A0A2K8NY67_9MOLU|nr:ribosome biogenesis GTP-binding protein YihA/YsxC [Williamsoniiplasma somnilux]ATZ18772.1 GTP-binding protein [Williamsoniiplasma somnilux]
MIKQAIFIKSAADKTGWIIDEIPEIVFVGRSNVGKSTFINAISNQNKLAKVSQIPGKTRLLNFFDINNGLFRIVDAPGYGYAKVNEKMRMDFAEMMEDYLTTRTNLKGVCMLVDLRHKPTNDDKEMYSFFKSIGLNVLLVATKLDKVKKNDIIKNEKMIKQELKMNSDDQFVKVSSPDKKTVIGIYQEFINLLERE